MGDPFSGRSNHAQTLRNKFELEKRRIPYTDHHYEDVKTRLNTAASPISQTQSQKNGFKDEIVRHMSNLPSYLETRKDAPDKAFNFGVMDWGRLQKWQYQHHNQHYNKYSPSSSNSSPLFSTAGSTPQSTVGQRCSFAGQRPPRMTLQAHLNTTPRSTRNVVTKLQDFYPPKVQESVSLKGKMKMEDPVYRTREFEQIEREKAIFFSPKISREDVEKEEKEEKGRLFWKNNTSEGKRSSFSSKNSFSETGNLTASKSRSMSPLRRFSFSNAKRTERTESPVFRKATPDNYASVSMRSHPSPLRRLFEPLFQSKATNSRQVTDSKLIANSQLDLKNDMFESTSPTQALFQSVVKNGRPLFTFAIENNENNSNILAATVRDLSSSGKDNNNHWIYTFFTVDEIKKKNASWLSTIRKDKGQSHSYAPNVTAQMMVTNRSIYNSDTREFSLFRVSPYDELAAIVVKFSRSVDGEENQDRFSTTVILPGGNHGVASNGKPSPLIDRWRSGGVCDCGGWDLGCRLRISTNQVQSSGRSNSPNGQFELLFQGDVMNRRFFSLCPISEGMFSVEYNSSVSPLQAFSICISVLECRKSSQLQESTTYVARQVRNDPSPVRFASFPPLSPVGRV